MASGGTHMVGWYHDLDIPIEPPVDLAPVYARMKTPPRPGWRSPLEGGQAANLVDALAAEVENGSILSDDETAQKLELCLRERSPRNRERAMMREQGICQGCDIDYGNLFGYGILDVHHLDRLSTNRGKVVRTKVNRLAVLCPTCHRIVHRTEGAADPIGQLRAWWAVVR